MSAAAVTKLLDAAGCLHWNVAAAIMLVIATTVSVAGNGLACTSASETSDPPTLRPSDPSWSGRTLGVQNTCQFITVRCAEHHSLRNDI
jgi:hypothetical protein